MPFSFISSDFDVSDYFIIFTHYFLAYYFALIDIYADDAAITTCRLSLDATTLFSLRRRCWYFHYFISDLITDIAGFLIDIYASSSDYFRFGFSL